jgi:hypothetical protein
LRPIGKGLALELEQTNPDTGDRSSAIGGLIVRHFGW